MLETKGLNELLQEERDAVIEREGNLGGREPFRYLIPATRDQLGTIRSQKLVKHMGMIRDRFLSVRSKLLRRGISAYHSGGSSSTQRWLMTGGPLPSTVFLDRYYFYDPFPQEVPH